MMPKADDRSKQVENELARGKRRLRALGSALMGAIATLLVLFAPPPTLAMNDSASPRPPAGNVFTTTTSVTTSQRIGAGTRRGTLGDRDPINMATGEYYFSLDLFSLGGPLPLGHSLYYGSQLESKRQPDGLPARLSGNHRVSLTRVDFPAVDRSEFVFEPGLGAEVTFGGPGGEWAAAQSEGTRYQVQETADWYYVMDPIQEVVWTLRKPASSLSARVKERANLTVDSFQSASGGGYPSISASGRYVAFDSAASDLVRGDTNAAYDVFVRDRGEGTTTRVSVSSSGAQGNGASYMPSMSADGRYVAFYSSATNLVTGDANLKDDIFVHDRQTGQTTRVSVSSSGAEANGHSRVPAISGDGRYVVFESFATNLSAADTGTSVDLYLHDRTTGETTLISVSSAGVKGNSFSLDPAISSDGRYIAFESAATNLVAGDTNLKYDIFVYDRVTAQTTRVSVDSNGNQVGGDSYDAAISADGRYVAFTSASSLLVSGDTNTYPDVFVHDRQTGQTTRVSVSSAGAQAATGAASPGISPDGRFVAFYSSGTTLVAGDTNAKADVFVHDRLTGETARISVDRDGNQADGNSMPNTIALSSYGRFLVFASSATNLVAGDWNGAEDLFVAARLEPQAAYLTRLEDRNGNALTYENPADIANRGPDRVSDGLGRSLQLTYTTVAGQPYLTQIADQTGRTVTLGYESSPSDNAGAVVLRAITDTLGNVRTFRYGGDQRITSQILPRGNVPYTQTYNTAYTTRGVVEAQADAYGNTSRLQADQFVPYDKPDSRFTITYPDGSQRVFTHTHDARVAQSVTDPTGRQARFGVDSLRDQLTSVTDRLGNTATITYHLASGKLAGLTNARGGIITYTYTAQDQAFTNPVSTTETVTFTFYNLSRLDYPDGTSEQFTYDAHGNVLTQVDPAGNTWTFTYNSRGQVLTETSPAGGVTTFTYNADGTTASSADADTGTTTYSYDGYKRLSQVTYPDGASTQYGYDLLDRLTAVTDERGNSTTASYDANGNLTRLTDPAGQATQYSFDLLDRVTQVTDPMGNVATYAYDALGRASVITDPTGIATRLGYDPRGWPNQVTWGGQTWQTGYDAEGLPTSQTSPLGATTTTQRDPLGFLTRLTDPLGQTTTITRDAMSRPTNLADSLSRRTSVTYDGSGRLTGVTLPVSGTATYQRNGLGQLTQIADLIGQRWVLTRTVMGRLQGERDPLGRTRQHSYDSRGRLSQTTFPDGTILTRTYDAADNLTRLLSSDGTDLQYGYDALNRITSTTGLQLTRDALGRVTATADGATAFGATYDAAGRLQTATYPPQAGQANVFTVTYTYSPTTGLLMRVADSLTGAGVDFTYDSAFRLVGLRRSNGVHATLTWDAADRLTRIQDGTLLDLQYTLDAAGQVVGVSQVTPLDPATVLVAGDDTFSFDGASQLATTGYGYDGQGRLTAAPGSSLTWDGASRLTGVGGAGLTYNGFGDLRTRTVGGSTVRSHYNAAISAAPIVAEQDDTTGQLLRSYVWTPDGQLLYLIDGANGNAVRFFHFDRTGSTLALTDASGQVTDAYAYDPYGRLLARTGTSAQPFTFVGQHGVRQEGSGGTLYQMRARYYDAGTGRFVSRDPIWPQTWDPPQLNPYQYGRLNPLSFVDPTGEATVINWRFTVFGIPVQIRVDIEVGWRWQQIRRALGFGAPPEPGPRPPRPPTVSQPYQASGPTPGVRPVPCRACSTGSQPTTLTYSFASRRPPAITVPYQQTGLAAVTGQQETTSKATQRLPQATPPATAAGANPPPEPPQQGRPTFEQPRQEQWEGMTPAEREEHIASLLATISNGQDWGTQNVPGGDPEWANLNQRLLPGR